MTPELSVVVPVHNEADNLAPLTGEIRSALDGWIDYELIYVDDGSDDGTAECLATLASGFPRLRVIRHLGRAGQSAAIVDGVRAAERPGSRRSTVMARTTLPTSPGCSLRYEIPGLRRTSAGGGLPKRRQDSPAKRVSSRTANAVRARLLGDATPDTGCGLKLFSREAFLSVPQFDHMHRFLPALFLRNGWRFASVQVNHRPRRRGRSHYGVLDRLWVGIVDLAGVLWLKRRAIHPTVMEAPDER